MKLNIPNLFNFLLLVSFVSGATVDSGYNMKQRKIATKTKLRNNWDETPETAITSLITKPEENIINRELNSLAKYNYKIGGILRKHVNGTERPNNFYRGIRNIIDKSQESDSLECLSCFGNGVTKRDEDCYRGIAISSQKCSQGQHCYVELQEDFIKRGCISKNKMNRTFVCKCPLCNDKPSDNPIYYGYDTISDWSFHNKYLQIPLKGTSLVCKICETGGTSTVSDNTCRRGKYTNYMVCSPNQICFMSIHGVTNFVSRGCINKPITNSFFTFCNKTLCNVYSYENPKTTKIVKAYLRTFPSNLLASQASYENKRWIIIFILNTILCSEIILN